MKVFYAQEIRDMERQCKEQYKMPMILLMENAGLAVANEAEKMLESCQDKKIVVYVGTGNNAGDAFVASRHLINRGARVKVFILGTYSNLAGDTRTNFDILIAAEIEIVFIKTERDKDRLHLATGLADLIVDAMIGINLKGELTPLFKECVDVINKVRVPVLAIDIPTGVNADTGEVMDVAVCANKTVSFLAPKMGLLLSPGCDYAGDLAIVDIGMPQQIIEKFVNKKYITEFSLVKNSLPERKTNTYKNEVGQILVFAGAVGFAGAAELCSKAAMRSGVGIVDLFVPQDIANIIAGKSTEVMVHNFADKNIIGNDLFLLKLKKANSILIGCGMGSNELTETILEFVLDNSHVPVVIDADALKVIGGNELLKNKLRNAILTPHVYEMSVLTGLSVDEINANRVSLAKEYALKYKTVLVLKGALTVIALPTGEIYLNPTGNPALATAGSGDVLAGIISGLAAQGLSPEIAAITGVYLHGMTGDILVSTNKRGIIASDLINNLPITMSSL